VFAGLLLYLSRSAVSPGQTKCMLPDPAEYNVQFTKGDNWVAFHRFYVAPEGLNEPFEQFLLSRMMSEYNFVHYACGGISAYEFNVSSGSPAHKVLVFCDQGTSCQVIDLYYCGSQPAMVSRLRSLCSTQTNR